ncbi:unnamed protein product [Mytilus edulis]|uniref:Uncharacterized protein n=1 Tax=Mytilus edulis TaxID=6550 RepID=A0A8S3QUD6_MYTED|nr:unnamed protein product [Mytilus edulis]
MENKNAYSKIFVMTKDDIKEDICKWQYHTHTPYDFGIVIPDEFLQQYIEKWLDDFTQSCSIYNESRPFTNDRFVNAIRNYMKRLSSDKIASLIKSANEDFIYNAFVMKDKDIIENSTNKYEIFGIIIPTDLLQLYIERWFYHFKEGSYINKNAGKCRLLSDVTFRTALLIYINEINTDTIASLIQTGNKDFFYSAFVMAEVDIKEDAEYVYELFGIIIPKNCYRVI